MSAIEKVEIIYQDEDLAVVNKPALLHSVAQAGSPQALSAKLGALAGVFLENPDEALLQRLDYETSGAVLVAKTLAAQKALREQFNDHQISKEYLILCEGTSKIKIHSEVYLGSRYRGSKKVSVTEKPQPRFLQAATDFQSEQFLPEKNLVLLRARTSTGRRHQVRAQAAHLGFPLVGDQLYGSKLELGPILPELELPPFILHAQKISFCHPRTNKQISLTAPLPDYLKKLKV